MQPPPSHNLAQVMEQIQARKRGTHNTGHRSDEGTADTNLSNQDGAPKTGTQSSDLPTRLRSAPSSYMISRRVSVIRFRRIDYDEPGDKALRLIASLSITLTAHDHRDDTR